MATRRIGSATFDHGAQYFTAKDARFATLVEDWIAAGVVRTWFRNRDGSHPRFRGHPSMTAVPKFLASELDVRLGKPVAAVRRSSTGWTVEVQDEARFDARAVLLTPPARQTLDLLASELEHLDPKTVAALRAIDYEPCLAVMALLSEKSRLPPPGMKDPSTASIARISDNQAKGISRVPAVTIHASATFSRENWNLDRREAAHIVLQAILGADVVDHQIHGWRYSKPTQPLTSGFFTLSDDPPLVVAGDALMGARVEGAVRSGWAAATGRTAPAAYSRTTGTSSSRRVASPGSAPARS